MHPRKGRASHAFNGEHSALLIKAIEPGYGLVTTEDARSYLDR